MYRLSGVVVAAACLTLFAGCARHEDLAIPAGSEVSLEKRDGVTVAGRLVEVQPEEIVLESAGGQRTRVRRADIARINTVAPSVSRAAGTPEPAPTPAAPATERAGDKDHVPSSAAVPEYREVTVPAGTVVPIELTTAVASDTSQVEDAVRGTVRRAITIDGVEAVPAGTRVSGHVTEAARSGRVKGRARIAFRFTQIDLPGDAGRTPLHTSTVAREAEATKKQDAAKIGGGAAGGAVIGAIVGGGSGAAKGAAIGGAAGTGVVVATRGKEVRLGPGAAVSVKLTEPLRVLVRR